MTHCKWFRGRHTALVKWLKNASKYPGSFNFPTSASIECSLIFNFVHGFKMAFASPGISSIFYSQRWCIKWGGSVLILGNAPINPVQTSIYIP